jgi:hypothetical protein
MLPVSSRALKDFVEKLPIFRRGKGMAGAPLQ